MSRNTYRSGDWNIICDVCSKKIKFSTAKKRWDGFLVCPDDYEMRHPQDFVKARQDKISVPDTRPRPPDVFKILQPLQDYCVARDDDHISNYMLYDRSNPYFLEDYLEDIRSFTIVMSWNKSYNTPVAVSDVATISSARPLSDTIAIADTVMVGSVFRSTFLDITTTVSDAGTILNKDYVDNGYFLQDYVGTTYTF